MFIKNERGDSKTSLAPKLATKLKNILHADKFCCVCFEDNTKMCYLDEVVTFDFDEGVYLTNIGSVLYSLLPDKDSLHSDTICTECQSQAVSAFKFVNTTKWSMEIIDQHLQQLQEKLDNVLSLSDNQFSDDCQNTVIVLDASEMYNVATTDYDFDVPMGNSKLFFNESTGTLPFDFLDCNECVKNPCQHVKYLEYAADNCIDSYFPCSDCEHVSVTKQELIQHVNQHLYFTTVMGKNTKKNSSGLKSNIKFRCYLCKMVFATANRLKQHAPKCRVTSSFYKCLKCQRTYDTEEKLANHAKTHEYFHKCDLCPKSYQTFYSLSKHKETHTNPEVSKKRIYSCYDCDVTFDTAADQSAHNIAMHQSDQEFYCKRCERQFLNATKFRSHMRQKHFHRQLECEFCDYKCKTEYEIDTHMNKSHYKKEPYSCDVCQKKFFGQNMLISHMKTHISKVEKGHQCDLCSKMFSTPAALRKHVKVLHLGERPYVCEICGQGFISPSLCATHKIRKHGEKKESCPLCDMKFYVLADVRAHIKVVHWKSDEPFDLTKILSPKQLESLRDKRKIYLENNDD